MFVEILVLTGIRVKIGYKISLKIKLNLNI